MVDATSLSDDDLAAWGLNRLDVQNFLWWVDGDVTHKGPLAIAKVLRSLRGGWPALGALMLVPPVSWLSWPIYRAVARHRSKLPGAGCALR